MYTFPKNFIWGSATSSYQIEGGASHGGKGPSIWDTFSHAAGNIVNQENGDCACEHIHKYKEDIQLMKEMGLKAYRFSISWPRILPHGTGTVNQEGVRFYHELIDELLRNDIEPYITLYHWDLPQVLQDKGGWEWDGISDAFAYYAGIISKEYSDSVTYFATLNEPQCSLQLGHETGVHAPGFQLTGKPLIKIMHNLLLAHGKGIIALREHAVKAIQAGVVTTGNLCYPSTESEADIKAARTATFQMDAKGWGFHHTWFWDPICFGKYPEFPDIFAPEDFDFIKPEDFDIISQPLDFMGVNVYNGHEVRDRDGVPEYVKRKQGNPKTALGWPICEEVMDYGLHFLYERYKLPIFIMENGLACNDKVYLDGKVHDVDRIDFTDRYLKKLWQSVQRGTDIRGYFHWSLMDNFEWNEGYWPRFGLIYVDYETQKRILKDSALWYRDVIERNGLE